MLAQTAKSSASDAARFEAIVACSSDAIISKSLDGIVQTWNPAAEALFGWTAVEMVGHPITRIIPAQMLSEEADILARIRRGEIVPKFQTERLTKNGKLIPIAVTVSPVRNEQGDVVGASKIANDLREHTQLADEARRSTDQFTALANNIPQLAWIADPDGWIFWYNQRWYDYTGTTLEEMQGWGWEKVHHPDHVDRVVEKISKAWKSGEPWEDTFPLRRHDGAYCWFLSRANALKDDEGNVVLWCGTNTDITEELEAKEHIRLLMREVNHRSRNMLATIQAMVNRADYATGKELANALGKRIVALRSNQEILDGGDWSGARIADIVDAQIQHVGESRRAQIDLSGPEDLVIDASKAEALGLAIHELATNAEKYGALSTDAGRISIRWKLDDSRDGEPMLEFLWKESGGPSVTPPSRMGFGSMLIKRNIEAIFQTEVTLDFRANGLCWSFACPANLAVIDRIERVEPDSYV